MSKLTPKEKAQERFRHYLLTMPVNNGMSASDEIEFAKVCAKSECEEIITVLKKIMPDYKEDSWHPACWWEQVRQELLKL